MTTAAEFIEDVGRDVPSSRADPYGAPLRRRTRRQRLALDGLLALVGIAFILPLLWLIDAAFNLNATQAMNLPTLTLSNFKAAIAAGAGGAIKNSLYLAIVSTIIVTAVSILAAYAIFAAASALQGTVAPCATAGAGRLGDNLIDARTAPQQAPQLCGALQHHLAGAALLDKASIANELDRITESLLRVQNQVAASKR